MTGQLLEKVDLGLQLLFIAATTMVLLAKFNTGLSGFLKYGKTLSSGVQVRQQSHDGRFVEESPFGFIVRMTLDLKVPKFWFFHFYLLSLVLSTVGFIITHTRLRTKDTTHPFTLPDIQNVGTIPLEISRLAFFLIIGHSSRRFFETLLIFKYNRTSKMNITHYLVGIFFYTAINLQLFLNTDFKVTQKAKPDIVLFLSLLLFLVASTDQFLNHAHLSGIKKYRIPRYGLFQRIVCAHYLDEIFIYLAVFGVLRTRTSFLALVFVIVNLSISAIETRNYYKLREEGKVPKWSIIPFFI